MSMLYTIGRYLTLKVLRKCQLADQILGNERVDSDVGGEIKLNTADLVEALIQFEIGVRMSIISFVSKQKQSRGSIESWDMTRFVLDEINENVAAFIHVSPASSPLKEDIEKWRKKC